MRRMRGLPAFLVLALAVPAPFALALADNCSTPAGPATLEVHPFTPISTTNTFVLNAVGGSCAIATSPQYFSTAPACPPTGGPLPGELCGAIAIPPGGAVVCQWLPLGPSTVTDLFVGFDRSGDGHFTLGADPIGYRSFPVGVPREVTNNAGVPARWIAYPVSAVLGGVATDTTLVSCA